MNTYSKTRILAILLVGITASGLHGQPAPAASQKPELTINAYSGRPNPTTELTDEEVKALLSLVEQAEVDRSPDGASATPSLKGGYAGFVVGPLPGPSEGTHLMISIYRNWIEVRTFVPAERKSTAVIRRDRGHAVEKYLANLANARNLVTPKLKQRIEAQSEHWERRL